MIGLLQIYLIRHLPLSTGELPLDILDYGTWNPNDGIDEVDEDSEHEQACENPRDLESQLGHLWLVVWELSVEIVREQERQVKIDGDLDLIVKRDYVHSSAIEGLVYQD